MARKVSVEAVNELFAQCVKHTAPMNDSEDTKTGFVVGFRLFERIIHTIGLEINDHDLQVYMTEDPPNERKSVRLFNEH